MKFIDFLKESKEKHAVMTYMRANPVTSGHQLVVNKVLELAKKHNASAHVILSHSQDPKKNPLTPAQKIKHAKRAFPGVNVSASDASAPNFLAQAAKLYKSGVTHFHMVGGQDRVEEFKTLLTKYNGVKGPHGHFNFKHIEVHSAGDRDPDAEGVEGMSASKMREHATNGNFKEFRKGVPSRMTDAHAKELYNHVRGGMGIREDVNTEFQNLLVEGVHDQSIFKAVFLAGGPGSGKDYVLDNTLSGQGLTEINSDKALEFLMDKEGLDKEMPASEQEKRNIVRGRAKNITELRQRLALLGRNGLIINGTGDSAEKIARIKERLEDLGYDTSMIMVNTDDEVSKQRNIERGQRGGRTVPEDVRKQKWDAVQQSRPEFAKMFGDRYMEYDNSEDLRQAPPEVVKQKKDEMMELFKNVKEFVSQPPSSEQASLWVAHQLDVKDTLPVNDEGPEKMAHPESNAAQEAKKLGLKYYGFGRYGRDGKITHRSVHDKLVEVSKEEPKQASSMPVPGTSMTKKNVNEEFESLDEDLRNWFSKSHPEGDWKRINTKGEVVGPCAREPGEPKPKCMSREKRQQLSKKERAAAVRAKRKHDPNPERKGDPINVSNFGKGKLSESYSLSDSSALNLLLLGSDIDEQNLYYNGENDNYDFSEETKKVKLMRDKAGKVRTFMLRRAAAKEAHTKNGVVMKYKNGYVIKLHEENDDVRISEESIQTKTTSQWRETSIGHFSSSARAKVLTEGVTELTSGQEYAKGTGIETTPTQASGQGKITLQQVRQRKKAIQEADQINEIDKGIEPGLSMATGGENATRPAPKNKAVKKPFEEAIGAGGEMATSMSDYNENDLRRKGIDLKTFKAKRPIG
jgi:predicted ABC-type ATPase